MYSMTKNKFSRCEKCNRIFVAVDNNTKCEKCKMEELLKIKKS